MPLSGAEKVSVSEAFLECYGENVYWAGRTLAYLGKKGVSLLPDVQSRALTWQPFIDSGLSIAAWNTELARVVNTTQTA